MTEHNDIEGRKLEKNIYSNAHFTNENSKIKLNLYYRNRKKIISKNIPTTELLFLSGEAM